MKRVNDFREACLYGTRLKTWEPDEIASFASPNGVKFQTSVWSISAISLSLMCVISQFVNVEAMPLFKQNGENHTLDSWPTLFYSKVKNSSMFQILELLASELFEWVIQLLYLVEITSGKELKEPFAIRVQLYLVYINVILCCLSFSYAVIRQM